MTEQNAESGVVTCIYCGNLEEACEMTDVPMEEGEHVTLNPAELPQGVGACEVWETRIAHKCRACMASEKGIVN